jgi:hypothetical protein
VCGTTEPFAVLSNLCKLIFVQLEIGLEHLELLLLAITSADRLAKLALEIATVGLVALCFHNLKLILQLSDLDPFGHKLFSQAS